MHAHPMLIASTFVVAQYLNLLVHPAEGVRPMVFALLAALGIVVASSALLRSRDKGALFATGLVLVVMSKPLVAATSELAGRQPLITAVFVGAAMLATAIATRLLSRSRASLVRVNRGLNTFAALLLAVVLVTAIPSGFPFSLVADLGRPTSDPAFSSTDPDIYVVMLDAYPGSSTLERVFEFDNGAFLSQLEDRGLDVATEARANYWFTSLTLASLFHMEPVTEVPGLAAITEGRSPAQPRWRQLTGEAPVFEILRGRGYRLVTVASGWTEVSLRSADTFVDTGQANDFEIHLLRETFLGDAIGLLFGQFFVVQQRDRIDSVFDAVLAASSEAGRRPLFVFAHVPAPHPPLAVEADGSEAEWATADAFYGITTSQMGITTDDYKARFLEQLEYANRRTLEVVDAILEADKSAIVIVMSDHGPGNPGDGLAARDIDERARLFNLAAVRHPWRNFRVPNDLSPVNLFPMLFNAYFGMDLPLHDNTSFRSTVFGTAAKYRSLAPIPEWQLTGQ
jgi:hypothetical protein